MDAPERRPGGESGFAVALLVHMAGGVLWGSFVARTVGDVGGALVATVWGLSALILWFVSVSRMQKAPTRELVWRSMGLWYGLAVLGPLGFAAPLVRRGGHEEEDEVDHQARERLDRLERELGLLRAELPELRREQAAPRPEASAARAEAPAPAEPLRTAPAQPRLPEPIGEEPVPQLPPREPTPFELRMRELRERDVSELLGPRALAIAGGVVMLLGILFFFVLAVNRGWIGPGIRVACGAAASAIAFGAGWWIRRRYEAAYSAVAAVGAGIAGGYATVLAAAALYDLLPDWGALLAAAAIAGIGVATSLAWSSEIVAGLGLIGAMVVPAFEALDHGLTSVGTGFVAVVLAGTIVVAVAQGWGRLLDAAALASAPQIAVLVLNADDFDRRAVVALAALFWLLFLAAGIAWQAQESSGALSKRAATLVALTSLFSALAAGRLLGGADEGVALLVMAAVNVVAAVAVTRRERLRELSAVLGAAALAIAAVGVSDLLSGGGLTAAWAAEGAMLAFLASRLRDVRLELGAVAYLALATGHALAFEGRPTKLLVDLDRFDVARRLAHPAVGLPVVLVAAAGFAGAAWLSRRDLPEPREAEGVLAFANPFVAGFHRERPKVALGEAAAAGVLVLYGAALGILGLFRLGGGDPVTAFGRGQVAIAALWAAVAVVLIAAGLRGRAELRVAGLVWLGVTLVLVCVYDLFQLGSHLRGLAALELAAALLIAAVLEQRAASGPLEPLPLGMLVLGVPLAIFGTVELVSIGESGIRAQGAALLAVAAVYGAVAAWLARSERDFATLLGLASLGIAAFAASELTSGVWLVLAWTCTAAALAALGAVAGEERLTLAAVGFLALALCHILVLDAPVTDLFTARAHPGGGIPALVILLAGGAVVLRLLPAELERFRLAGTVAEAVVVVYACSLAILAVAQQLGGGDVSARFQRGHTAVSSLWGLIGVVLLYVGLRRSSRALRLGGLALLGVGLAKIFLYDLPNLSSITRALSFLGVGALLIVAGLVYQRLTLEERPPVP